MPQGKGTYGSKKGRPPKKMNMGGMTINKRTLNKMTPKQLASDTMSQYFTSKVDESKGPRRPGMKKGGVAVKKMNMGGMTINKRTNAPKKTQTHASRVKSKSATRNEKRWNCSNA